MMKSCTKRVLLLVAGLLSAIILSAQELPVLSPDNAVKTGTLPNGMSYYIVSNPSVKGVADFALVQKTGLENIPDTSSARALSVARDALTSLPRCKSGSVQEFFTSHGVTPGKDGFVRVTDNTTEFRFSNVLLSRPEVLDSALLVVMDMVDRISTTDDPFIRKWYSPADQAVVIAGDVDASSVAGKLGMLSYMTPAVSSSSRKEYVWNERDTAVYTRVQPVYDGLASFTVMWNSARTPREYMNTVQPVIYELFLAELGMLVEEYIHDGLRRLNIPVAKVECSYRTSLQSSCDEAFSVDVTVAEEDFPAAVEVVAQVMGKIDAGKADINDLIRMKRICMDRFRESSLSPVMTNSQHVDRCVAAFVYNGSLASLKTKGDFLAGRVLADSTEYRLFNNISSALLDPERNMEFVYSHDMPVDSVRTVVAQAWKVAQDYPAESTRKEWDSPYMGYEGLKVKLKSVKNDHMSNGQEWTFANGFKVIYRRMDTGDRLYYTLALNGGFGSIGNLDKGEGGYVSDYFMLSRISGIPADEFIDILESKGMSMSVHTGLNATMLSGSVDEDNVDLMMSSILSAVNDWQPDEDAMRYYESCEPLRHIMRKGTSAEMVARVNDIMCPNYTYVSYKMLESIPSALAGKAERFYKDIFQKTNDGVLIILGDVEPDVLRKKITSYIPGFKVTDRAFKRPLVRYQPASGWSTYTVEGDRNSVDMALSVPLVLTADNFMAAEVASLVLKKMLSEALVDSGMYLDISHECRVYPNERINFHILLNEISPDGFASDVEHSDTMDALAIVRSVLSGAGVAEVSKADVEMFKIRLKNGLDMEMKEPFYWLNVISRRHLAGKDFTTNHQARINSVTVEKVKDILSRLNEGTRVEYIVSRR